MRFLAFAVVAALAACGVDGPPLSPAGDPPPGVRIEGEARIGVVTSV